LARAGRILLPEMAAVHIEGGRFVFLNVDRHRNFTIIGHGQLVVYTALEVVNPVSSDFPTHKAYAIYHPDGKLFERVDNRSGSFYQSPASVTLPQGEYTVKAPVANYGEVSVPIVIKENETTTLDLNGGHFRQKNPTGAGQWVRLPSGEVIGMRAP